MIGPIETFQTEAREHLEIFELALLDLEKDESNFELINRAFRSMHTIKGGAGMFGFMDLTAFAHHVENLLDKIRNGEMKIGPEIIGTLLDICDFTRSLLEAPIFSVEQKEKSATFVAALSDFLDIPKPVKREADDKDIEQARLGVFHIQFTPDINSFRAGLDVYPILNELHQCGELFVTTHSDNIPNVSEYDPESAYLKFDCVLITMQNRSQINDVFMFVAEDWSIQVEPIDIDHFDETRCSLRAFLQSEGYLSESQTSLVIGSEEGTQQIPIHCEISPLQSEGEITSNQVSTQNSALGSASIDTSKVTIRVAAGKLDSLMNLVGELVIVQARLNQLAITVGSDDILSIAEELDLLTNQLRDETFGIRLVPIGSIFGRFRRLVRDLSVDLHKQVVLITEGEDTELDKMVIDKLSDPLIHIIRNAIDHGIESPGERRALHKSEQGTIGLKAEHAESHVLITITDDGKGLCADKIRDKALSQGLIDAADELSEEQLHQLIFEPGFSTATNISDISGRGVGMDVVKRSIQELGGKVTLTSTRNEGTQITISLPMTMAIIEGLLVMVGDEHFVLPLKSVEECIELPTHFSEGKANIIDVRGQQIPFIQLRKHFSIHAERPAIEQIVVLHSDNERFGFCVDEVVGQYQTVIKRLGRFYEGAVGYSGATIMGDGNVAIVLDPKAIIDSTAI